MPARSFCLVLLFLPTLTFLPHAMALTFVVDATKEECFFDEVPKFSKVSGSFHVAAGGSLDVDVKFTAPSGAVLYSVERETEGKFSFDAPEPGDYRFCFSNRMSTVTSKTVSFSFVTGDTESDNAGRKEYLTPLERSVRQVSQGLDAIIAEQKYMRIRERFHRNTTESTNARVLWWSFIEGVVLVAMSLWQIYYLRHFFEVKHPV